MSELRCVNRYAVSIQGQSIVTALPVPRRITRDEAINLAAWLIVMANCLSPDANQECSRLVQEITQS